MSFRSLSDLDRPQPPHLGDGRGAVGARSEPPDWTPHRHLPPVLGHRISSTVLPQQFVVSTAAQQDVESHPAVAAVGTVWALLTTSGHKSCWKTSVRMSRR